MSKWEDHPVQYWEKRIHGCLGLLARKNLCSTDELRRAVEALSEEQSSALCYYGKWSVAMSNILMEKGYVSLDDLDRELGVQSEDQHKNGKQPVYYDVGQTVIVRPENTRTIWKKPHLRTPGYLFGQSGVVERVVGLFHDPELAAYARSGPKQMLYRVRFSLSAVWHGYGYGYGGQAKDTVEVEVYHPWLSLAEPGQPQGGLAGSKYEREDDAEEGGDSTWALSHVHPHPHSHSHSHGEGGCGPHDAREEVERTAVDREGDAKPGERYAEAFLRALAVNGIVAADELMRAIEAVEMLGKSNEGARVVAKAWCDAEFMGRLLKDGNAAAAELGIDAVNANAATVLVAVQNTESLHHLVVCTLCSCYPAKLLGLSPSWYKTRSYRERAVREPREVLREFGTRLEASVQVRVVDSTADCRYMVIPQRPEGSESMGEDELAGLVTRDSMIGVSLLPRVPR